MSFCKIHRTLPSILLACIATVSIIMLSCNPTEPYPPGWSYYDPVDSVSKLIENFEISYITQDIGNYMQCFRNDFVFYYESNGDTLSWGYDTEEQIHQTMFNQIDRVWLTLSGSEQYTWSGDTTGATLVLARDYYLRIFIGLDDSTSTPAYGTAHFICRQDSMEEWYVWQWWDYPDPGRDGWSDTKLLFMTPPANH